MARAMVTQYGMTERLGAIKLGDGNAEPFLGRDIGHARNYSEEVAGIVDEETKKLLATAHQEAFDILEENRDVLDSLVLELLDKETLDKEQIAEVFVPLRRRSERPAWTGSPDRRPSTIPAVEIPEEIRDRAAANGFALRLQRLNAPRRPGRGPARSSPRPAPAATCTAPGRRGRHRAPDPAGPGLRRTDVTDAAPRAGRRAGVRPRRAPRPPSASC